MRRLSFLLRPGWIALVIGVIIFAGACFWILSPWQFGRNNERQSQIGDITTAEQGEPVALSTLLPNGAAPTANQVWHQVTMSGHYLPANELVARLRQVNDDPADEILTPFRLDNGRTVLVDRGWVAPNNGQVPAYASAPAGHVTLTTRVHQEESDAHKPPITENGRREIYSINDGTVTERTGVRLDPGYFTLVDNQPGVLNVLPIPQLDSGPFLSYAFQWIVFGVMAVGGLGYFTWREIQPGGALTPEGRARRRAERAARAEEEARTGKAVPAHKVRGRHAVAAMIAEEEAAEAEAATSTAEAGPGQTSEARDSEVSAGR